MTKGLPLLLTFILAASPALAQEEDAEGCKDSATLSRMNSCRIEACDKKDFDSGDIRIGVTDADFKAVEGEVERYTYRCEENVSFLAVVRNAKAALERAGYTIVFNGKGDNEQPAISARKGGTWVAIQTEQNGGQTYKQIVVRSKEMAQEMTASAEAFEDEIIKSGQCSIYGILFDTGKATIQKSSEECLNEVAKLLKKNAAWKMRIEGHTDSVGPKEANMTLSQQRAEAVTAWLAAHGIDKSRLIAKGLGDSKPVADNSTEDGRMKNRRVALVKL
jgi:outer membrane protein OmpA-like peptidoglycan-associated protein